MQAFPRCRIPKTSIPMKHDDTHEDALSPTEPESHTRVTAHERRRKAFKLVPHPSNKFGTEQGRPQARHLIPNLSQYVAFSYGGLTEHHIPGISGSSKSSFEVSGYWLTEPEGSVNENPNNAPIILSEASFGRSRDTMPTYIRCDRFYSKDISRLHQTGLLLQSQNAQIPGGLIINGFMMFYTVGKENRYLSPVVNFQRDEVRYPKLLME